jgi:hypothetical protein
VVAYARRNRSDNISEPLSGVDAVEIPIDMSAAPNEEVRHHPLPLSDNPVIENKNFCFHRSKDQEKHASYNV